MIIVTGGTGFLGAHLLGLLVSQGSRVRAVRRSPASMEACLKILNLYVDDDTQKNLIEWVDCDVLDATGILELVKEGDDVYHCAAVISFSKRQRNKMYKVNISGTANIVNACLEKKARKLCHVSSIGSLGDASEGIPVDEQTPRSAAVKHSGYGWTKYMGELEVFRGIAEGLNAVIVNPSVITGPCGSNQGIEPLVKLVQKGMKYFPNGSNAWIDARDVAAAMVYLMKSDITAERFIVSAENLSYQHIMTLIATALNVNVPTKRASHSLMNAARVVLQLKTVFTGKTNPLTKEMLRISTSVSSYDTTKFANLKAFTFIPIKQSIIDTVFSKALTK